MIAYSACVSAGVKGLSEGVLRELEEPGREGLFAPITPTNQNTAHSLIIVNNVVWIERGTCSFC